MNIIKDVKEFVDYAKKNPTKTFDIMAESLVLVSVAMAVGVLTLKGATALFAKKTE